MKRRGFIKIGLGAAAFAAVPGCAIKPPETAHGETPPPPAPRRARRKESLDFGWRFKPCPAPRIQDAVALNDWVWAYETPGMAEIAGAKTDFDASGPDWQHTNTDNKGQMDRRGFAWFRTKLPDVAGPNRAVTFTHVDDNCEIFLNGQKIGSHHGWSSPFSVELDAAWNASGPNILAVRVENNDGPGGVYGPAAVGRAPEKESFFAVDCDDRSWREVQVPHDYIVEGEYSSKEDAGHGSLPVFPAWYRQRFRLDPSDAGKCVWLYFEGVYRNALIYLNGALVGRNPGGYVSFHVNIGDVVKFDGENVLAVYVDPTDFEGWWYEGGGIYRHVWLNVADQTHIAPWGVYVVSEVTNTAHNPSAKLRIETTVANRTNEKLPCTLVSIIRDAHGDEVGRARSSIEVPSCPLPADARQEILATDDMDMPSYLHTGAKFEQEVQLGSVRLWSLEERHRYTVETQLWRDGKMVDQGEQKFGVRTLRFDPLEGFFLNEKSVKLNGVCNHQDFVGVGIGIPDSLFYYRMRKLQEFGCNAIRCSHNPMTPAMYEACDELGMLVMDENRHPGSAIATKAWTGQPYSNTWHVESMVLRDRNYPSVIMWSMWNEEFAIQNEPYARELMSSLMAAVYKYDLSRPVTCANNSDAARGAWKGGSADAEDLLGVNYNYQDFDILHREFPDKMVFGSEIGSNLECRGVYETDKTAAHQSSYMAPDDSWATIGRRQFAAGGFYWTGFDYRGETTPFDWPEINSNFGFLDMCGFPKDQAYYWKAWWQQNQPLVHIFPHWNWPDKAGQKVPVWCFSNCDEVELILNGRSLGRKTMHRFRHLQWDDVIYETGRLEAIGYIRGQLASRAKVETTGAAAAIKLMPDRTRLHGDGQDTAAIAVAVVDAQGRVVPTANHKITFAISGAGVNAGVGNGDPSCHEPNQADYRSAFNGYCMVLARAVRSPGTIHVSASADGLVEASVDLEVAPA